MVDRVRYTSILGNALVSEVDLAVSIYCYVLEESVTCDSSVDIWFRLFVEVDNLSVATTFEVEDTVVIPAVLVVTDEETLRIGRKGGFASSRKTEEDSGVLTVLIGVCRAVHRSDTLKWEEVVHHREHTFLHLSTIPCIEDNLLV